MSLTASQFLKPAPIGTFDFIVKNAVSMYAGMVAARDSGTGTIKPNAGAAGDLIWGFVVGSPDYGSNNPPTTGGGDGVVGDTGALRKPKFGVSLSGSMLFKQAVTGAVTTNQASVGATVYLNADDHTFTLTRPTRGVPVGTVLYTWSSGVADILFYGIEARQAIGLSGNGRGQLKLAGSLDWSLITNATQRTISAPFHGKFMSFTYRCAKATTGSGGTADIVPKIGGTALTGTGGGATLPTGTATGANIAGTAVTDDGTNEFHEGDSITLVGANIGGTQTAGIFEVDATIEYLPGA